MLASHRQVGSNEDMFILPSVFDKVTVPYGSKWLNDARLIIPLFSEVL
jgi:hypothetical protein